MTVGISGFTAALEQRQLARAQYRFIHRFSSRTELRFMVLRKRGELTLGTVLNLSALHLSILNPVILDVFILNVQIGNVKAGRLRRSRVPIGRLTISHWKINR